MSSKVTLSDVNVAVNKAYAAGLAGQAYEGLMPSAHDAGVHFAQGYEGTAIGLQQQFLAILLTAAADGFQDGSSGAMPRTGYYKPTVGQQLESLGLADVQAVYSEGFLAGSATQTNWTPWLVGGGLALAAAITGVVVISKRSGNPTSGYGKPSKRIGVAIGKPRGASTRRDHYGIYDDGTVSYEGFEYQSETGQVLQGLPLSGSQAAHMQVHTTFKPENFDEVRYFDKKNPVNVDYKSNDPKGWGGDITRGAAMGRHSYRGPADYSGKLALRRIRLDSGGYDPNGTYFGTGSPLFWFASEDGVIDDMLRAADHKAAKAKILQQYPNSKFYR